MVPEKGKPKARQASLTEPVEEKPDAIDRLVAQAFDSDPKVRLKVAEELGKSDDPRAIFALIELSSDKEEAVKEAALRSLDKFKKEEGEAIVSLEKLFAERRETKKPEEVPQVQQKMLPTIEKLFSHYDPKKRESVKRKLLPSLEKLFGIRQLPHSPDPLHGVESISHPEEKSEEAAPPQESAPKNATNFPFGQEDDDEAEKVPQKSHLLEIEQEEEAEGEEKEEGNEMAANKYYQLAYRIATTPGMGKAELKREQNRIISNFKKEVGMAFKMAEERAKEEGLASFSNLKPGMKNLSFSEMQVVGISDIGYGARKKPFAKIRLSDGKKEVSLLVPHERAGGISASDKIALKGVSVDFLVESNEVVLVAKPKSKIIIVK
ncbi:MAG: HEAT repeat domain-containing protein [Candidatus Micrarchaeota archaeon]|nr:HEAT repeat domain-containing protein [Candidatus Micrarchaeota archaeon]